VIRICIQPPSALVEAADIVSDRRIADLAKPEPGSLRSADVARLTMNIMLELECPRSDPKSAPVARIDGRRMEVADDDGRAVIGNAGKLGVGPFDAREMAENKSAPDDIERAVLKRHVANVAWDHLDVPNRTIVQDPRGNHFAAGLKARCGCSAGGSEAPPGAAAGIEQAQSGERWGHRGDELVF
jgi:hypothetical protein